MELIVYNKNTLLNLEKLANNTCMVVGDIDVYSLQDEENVLIFG